jgi:hypothetical protein
MMPQTGSPSPGFVIWVAVAASKFPIAALIVLVVAAVLITAAALLAICTSNSQRRQAALDVLRTLLRWRT